MAIDLNTQDGKGRTQLHNAVINKQPLLVAKLLTAGANPNIKDNYGRNGGYTPIWYATTQTHDPNSVALLKRANASVDQILLSELSRQSKSNPTSKTLKDIREALGY